MAHVGGRWWASSGPTPRHTAHSLQAYIQDVRNCATKEAERERVDKELGKIRKKYTSSKVLSGKQSWLGAAAVAGGWGGQCAVADEQPPFWQPLYCRHIGSNVEGGGMGIGTNMGRMGWKNSSIKGLNSHESSKMRGAAASKQPTMLFLHGFLLLCVAYDKRKYMWKLLYTRMLGYEVDFGHKQAMDLIAASE